MLNCLTWFALWRFWVILATAKTVGVHFLIFWYFFLHDYISSLPQAQVWKLRINTLSPPLKSPKITTLASLFSVPGWVGEFLLLVLGFGDPTKGMKRIWDHFVILVGCGHVIFKPQFMLMTIDEGLDYKNCHFFYGELTWYW